MKYSLLVIVIVMSSCGLFQKHGADVVPEAVKAGTETYTETGNLPLAIGAGIGAGLLTLLGYKVLRRKHDGTKPTDSVGRTDR